MSKKTWEMPDGIYTALVTPFADGKLDQKAWRVLVQRQIDAGVAGIVPAGCTGEAAYLCVTDTKTGKRFDELLFRRNETVQTGKRHGAELGCSH